MSEQEINEIKSSLSEFSGTENYYRHFGSIVYTDGIKYLCEKCQCYWLLDIVSSYQFEAFIKKEEFQVYKLKVNSDLSAEIRIEDGDYNVLAIQPIEYTDFPLPEITIWFSNSVILLPSEY